MSAPLNPQNPAGATLSWPYVHWLGVDTVVVVDRMAGVAQILAEEEFAYASAMTPARQREFASGRALARRAMQLLRLPPGIAIPIGTEGDPVWPTGVAGSISHTATHVAVLLSLSSRHASVGIDIDDERPLGSAAAAELMTDAEVQLVLSAGWTGDAAIAKNLVFSAKESLFKYQYPLTGQRDLDYCQVLLIASEQPGVLGASCMISDPSLQEVLVPARLFYKRIQGVRTCWAWQ